jgi:hypothetical protein
MTSFKGSHPFLSSLAFLGTTNGWFVGSHDLQLWTPIGAMNLIAFLSFAPPRNVTAMQSDAPARVARRVDWFRPATRLLMGETDSGRPSRWKDWFFFSLPGRARGYGPFWKTAV